MLYHLKEHMSDDSPTTENGLNSPLHSLIYNGEDVGKAPYAQLTEIDGSWATASKKIHHRLQLDAQYSLADLIYVSHYPSASRSYASAWLVRDG